MKTKIILHGGFKPGQKQESDLFFREILNAAPENAKILLVYFAKEEDRIEKNSKEDIEQFNKSRGSKSIQFEIATKEHFRQQMLAADVVYLHGGRTQKLLDGMRDFTNFKEMIPGKVIAGDSAGANLLCSIFYSTSMGMGEGFGIIPLKIICHYVEENKDKLKGVRPELETLFLPEYSYKVYEI